jgi:hypothetical protein
VKIVGLVNWIAVGVKISAVVDGGNILEKSRFVGVSNFGTWLDY